MEIIKIKKKDIIFPKSNPRSKRNPKKQEQLKKSIKTKGLLQLPIVRPDPTNPGKYLPTAGRGRLEAFDEDDDVEVNVKKEDELDAQLTGLTENFFREKMSNIDQEALIAEIFERGKKEGRWSSTQEMEDKVGISQETISRSILAYNERKTLGLEDPLNNRISTNDINESRPLLSQPKVRKKLLELRAKREIKGSGHVVHELAKRLSNSPNHIIDDFLEDKLDFSNLTKEIKSELDELQLKQKKPMPIQTVTSPQENLDVTKSISEKTIDDKKTQETAIAKEPEKTQTPAQTTTPPLTEKIPFSVAPNKLPQDFKEIIQLSAIYFVRVLRIIDVQKDIQEMKCQDHKEIIIKVFIEIRERLTDILEETQRFSQSKGRIYPPF